MSILDRFRLQGKVAVVTGAGKGIGAAIALACAEAGADVVLAARTRDDLARVAGQIERLGRRALVVPTDVLQESQLEALVAAALGAFGRIDVLVNNAGGFPPKAALATSTREFEWALRFNVVSAFALSRLLAPHLARSECGGAIVNISSVAGEYPSAGFAAYGTAKGALAFLTRSLAQEFAPRIRVNAIAVGTTRTAALDTILSPELERVMVERTPMGRLAEVEDIAACALFLASPAADYVSGQVVGVHGGLSALNMPFPRAFD